ESRVAATHALVTSMHVKGTLKFRKNFLNRLKAQSESDRKQWERFVAIRMQNREAISMYPRLGPRAALLLDRHYTSLRPYTGSQPNMYAVLKDGSCSVTYVERSNGQLLLRPHNPSFPIEVLPIDAGKSASDYIVGRVCHISMEA